MLASEMGRLLAFAPAVPTVTKNSAPSRTCTQELPRTGPSVRMACPVLISESVTVLPFQTRMARNLRCAPVSTGSGAVFPMYERAVFGESLPRPQGLPRRTHRVVIHELTPDSRVSALTPNISQRQRLYQR
jgi:hypothetical protein